jgi:hypothetical protein
MANIKTRFPEGMTIRHPNYGNGTVVGYAGGYFGPYAKVRFFTPNGRNGILALGIPDLELGSRPVQRRRSRSRSRGRDRTRRRK